VEDKKVGMYVQYMRQAGSWRIGNRKLRLVPGVSITYPLTSTREYKKKNKKGQR
jgi:hypothetical protein